jgi:hypothetical protein
MWFIMKRTSLACVALLIAGLQVRPEAGCAITSLDQFLKHPNVVAIFKGAVTKLELVPPSLSFPGDVRQIATMRVTLVWKGSVAPETRLYFYAGEGGPSGVIREENEYLVIAHQLSPENRTWFHLPSSGERALGANELGCGAIPVASPSAARLIGEAPGYSPQ